MTNKIVLFLLVSVTSCSITHTSNNLFSGIGKDVLAGMIMSRGATSTPTPIPLPNGISLNVFSMVSSLFQAAPKPAPEEVASFASSVKDFFVPKDAKEAAQLATATITTATAGMGAKAQYDKMQATAAESAAKIAEASKGAPETKNAPDPAPAPAPAPTHKRTPSGEQREAFAHLDQMNLNDLRIAAHAEEASGSANHYFRTRYFEHLRTHTTPNPTVLQQSYDSKNLNGGLSPLPGQAPSI